LFCVIAASAVLGLRSGFFVSRLTEGFVMPGDSSAESVSLDASDLTASTQINTSLYCFFTLRSQYRNNDSQN